MLTTADLTQQRRNAENRASNQSMMPGTHTLSSLTDCSLPAANRQRMTDMTRGDIQA
jgi:hypothetical protein